MEVALTGTLLLLGVRGLVSRAWLQGGTALALAGLARPESAGVTLVLSAAVVLALTRKGADRESPLSPLVKILGPSVLVGAAYIGYDLWASGSPLPATFYAKTSGGILYLPGRLATALVRMLPGIPPFGAGLGWLALVGFAWAGRSRDALAKNLLPLLGGAAFLLANLLVLNPGDPPAFYHLRYILPAVPLLLVALAIGAHAIGVRLGGPAALAPLAALVALSLVGALLTARSVSLHHHNDVRNINEVQRRMGEWLAVNVRPGTWIAASDAGAVRYFSNLPTIDVIGLNTPEMLEHDEAFVRAHPVEVAVLMPSWFNALDADQLQVSFQARTENYTVTSNPKMAVQAVVRARDGEGSGPVRARFTGFHAFQLDFVR
jgi:hypothetical protein